MNKETRYEIIRNLTQEEFDFWKKMRKMGHTSVFENLAEIVRIAIAVLLGYVSYKTYNVDTVVSILSGISTPLMLFSKRLVTIIPSIIASIKTVKNKNTRTDITRQLVNMREKIIKHKGDRMIKLAEELDKYE